MELIYIPQGELQRRIFAISPILRQNSVSGQQLALESYLLGGLVLSRYDRFHALNRGF
jgi:hypothetical protein